MDARAVELKWLVKCSSSSLPFERSLMVSVARMNSVLFSLLWILSPILVAVVGFFTFVIQGNALTVSNAFTVRL